MKYLALPFVFLYHLFIVVGGLIFPTTLIMGLGFLWLLATPFIWIINFGLDKKIESDFPFIDIEPYALGHFLGITIILWFPFYGTWYYYKYKKLVL